ncbi:polyamine deacetylase HDAC10 isoform X1 [Corythoichthys intestinalis]|uniref:polyamine deacetylase HDAC10 isoform X1 n=2 Tax=Corythoichthys intestinalis TaxID=161448 RepID=UPI0025A54E33|nr:polyamine deacetylase HDAC10 isoform X1 [Corythoichthys intestinalis]
MGTALVYDEEMTRYKLLWLDPDCEIERPERLTASHEALLKSGLATRCVSIPVRQATDAEILLIHSEEYLEAVKKTPHMTLQDLQVFTQHYGAVYFHPNSYHCATLAVGAALQLVDGVLTGTVRNGIALVRPPGHHSMRSAASGFCVFNNVAIAAKYAQQKYGVQRVLIVDWDIHHGQGVQYAFEDDPNVLYFSWHRYEHQKFWPELRESDYDSVGKDKGAGFNINVPWNKVGMQNSDYLAVFFHILLPVAYEFCPDLVLVCAGFDSAIGDPEGEMCATPDIFAHLTHLLMNLAGGKLCAVLEGGYNLTSLSQSVCATVQTLLGDPAPRPANLQSPSQSAVESIHCVRAAHRKYWSCLRHAPEAHHLEVSTKRIKREETDEKMKRGEAADSKDAITWPEPQKCSPPSVRTAVVLPKDVTCPDGCKRFNLSQENVSDDATLATLTALVGKMENEICNGLALVGDVSVAMASVAWHATALKQRVLVVCVGGTGILSHMPENGTTLTVHIKKEEPEELRCKHYIPVCLKSGFEDVSELAQATLSLLLPIAYEYDPGLVLLAQIPCTDRPSYSWWQQLVGLLLGLAQARMLVLMQEGYKALLGPTASSLTGTPAPSLGRLCAPPAETVEALDSLRRRLQVNWMLLRMSVQEHGGEDK